jgi:hypothetical protein
MDGFLRRENMGYQQFFRKPQLHRPCAPAVHQFPMRDPRGSNIFLDRLREKSETPASTPKAPAGLASPHANTSVWPLAANLVSGLIVIVSALLLILIMVR